MEMVEDKSLECPEKFDFPFPPYDIQNDFMKALYQTIENKKFGIFESPTGTGKSLSIICGATRWLKDHNEAQRKVLSDLVEQYQVEKEKLSKETTDWLILQSKEIEISRKLDRIRFQLNKILDYEDCIKKIIQSVRNKEVNYKERKFQGMKRIKSSLDESKITENIDDEMLVANEIEDEIFEEEDEDEDDDKYEPVKIYICSRTHSQLAQFVGEIVKSPFGKDVRAVSLGSRQVYCINPEVKRLKSMALINERCLDMQKKSVKSKKDEDGKTLKKQRTETKQCPYYKPQNIEDLRSVSLAEVLDVEDLIVAGKELKACPYYASRKAVDDSEIVLIPYNTLLHKATREANGIKLKNNVVIVDEAHNLLESLAQMHNSEVNFLQIDYAYRQLSGYKMRFATRFSSANLLMINQLIFVIKKLKNFLDKNSEVIRETKTEIFTVGNFVLTAEIDNFNLFKLIKFVKNTKISQKIHHYALKYPDDEISSNKPAKGLKSFLTSLSSSNKQAPKTPVEPETSEKKPQEVAPVNPLLSVISFLESLTYSYEDGRVMMVQDTDLKSKKFQFLLLNPSSQFTDIVKEARSVIVAGGTMKPIGEFKNRLFISSGVALDKIVEFSCDHIISPDNILPIIVNKGLQDQNLYFNFENRMKLGPNIRHILEEACKKVEGGIVVFFPSYHYENWVWEQLKDVSFGRPVFREPKNSGSVEAVLEKYAAAIKRSRKTGALLFSVVGGKLSEGLNFSDDLGRCVIVVGMPYANIKAADLKEKMNYLNEKEGTGAGNEFYENLCMKSVNQCIGRAVRHKNDYAVVLLIDERYNRTSTKNALPGWIKRSLQVSNSTGAFKLIEKFFQLKNN
ncbi:ATP-dependent DNA helicase DDX11 isoform X2 [Coccinella septempunctata]|uniref:ATP-dependent DNA helicase DDX11 isoform X2 n=1 Tax=Coccinella septempunctata TaxID=41139 RepID=UPI001D0937A9|nr:ATP-dependent DNA helicase DDX11 isoform X2 [Coccinella septempunctata]